LTTAEVIPINRTAFRTVEVVRRAEADRWDIVQAVQADIDAEFPAHAGDSSPGPKGPEYHDLCSRIADAAREEGADSWKTQTVSNLYRVAVAWPPEDRVQGATYGAHERLFAREDRVQRLTRLVERSSDGHINRNDVDLWLSTLRPSNVRGFLDGMEHAVRSVLRNKGKPWSKVEQGDRDAIATFLEDIAEEIREGRFPK
jgi:hypothetical protein